MVGGGGDGMAVGMSPLVASVTDALLQLLQLDAHPEVVSTYELLWE